MSAGIVSAQSLVAPLIETAPPSPSRPSMSRHFSAFPLTSHLHTPVLRLVSLHPLLSLEFEFLRVPQIHDGFTWNAHIARDTTVGAAVESTVVTLGLTRNLPVAGVGSLEYVLEEVWTDGGNEGKKTHS